MIKWIGTLCSPRGIHVEAGRIARAVVLDDPTLQVHKQSGVPAIHFDLLFSSCNKAQTVTISLINITLKRWEKVSDSLVVHTRALNKLYISTNFPTSRAMNADRENLDNFEKAAETYLYEPNSMGQNILETKYIKQSETTGDAKYLIFASENLCHDATFFDSIDGGKDFKLPEGAVLLRRTQMSENISDSANFRGDLYFTNLLTEQYGKSLLWSPCLPSTHTLLSQNFQLLPLGTVCIADVQLNGKGRTGNVWESPQGCLMFSFTVRMDDGHALPFLQYIVSIAMIEAIESICSQKGLPAIPVKIKWPNDLYANGMKVGGVLCTSTYTDKKFNVVVGIGLNVANREPTTCLDALLQDLVDSASPFEREVLLAAFFERFEGLFKIFLKKGFLPLESSYYSKWLHSGQKVVLEERQEDSSASEISLVVQGLSPTGFLLAIDDQMEKFELHPDGNRFDFLKGLVRTKLQSKNL